LVVARRRKLVSLTLDRQLIVVELAADLGPRLLVRLGLCNIRPRRRVGRRRHLVRVVIVDPGRNPLLLGQAGKPVVIDVLRDAAMLMAVPAELLGWLVRALLCHHAPIGCAGRTGPRGTHNTLRPARTGLPGSARHSW
jgi:hypothetical protein